MAAAVKKKVSSAKKSRKPTLKVVDNPYYDWGLVFSKDKHINVVTGARGIGKTFGLRLQTIRDYIKHGYLCIEVVRFKDEIQDAVDGYHNKLAAFFPKYEFRSDSTGLYIRKKVTGDKKPPPWERYGFIAALSVSYKKKRRSYPEGVHRIIFDEFALDPNDTYARYLKNELDALSRIISTATRQRADGTGGKPPYVYLLSNATDRFNPYYEAYGFDADKFGITIKDGRLFHNVEVKEDIYRGTVAHMVAGESRETQIAAGNAHAAPPDLCKVSKRKPSGAVALLAVKWKDDIYTLYRSPTTWYVQKKPPPKNSGVQTIGTRLADGGTNIPAGKWLRKKLRPLSEMYGMGMCVFDTPDTYRGYLELMEWLSI